MLMLILKVAVVVIGIGGVGVYTGLKGQYFNKDAASHWTVVVVMTVLISLAVVGVDLLNAWMAKRKK